MDDSVRKLYGTLVRMQQTRRAIIPVDDLRQSCGIRCPDEFRTALSFLLLSGLVKDVYEVGLVA